MLRYQNIRLQSETSIPSTDDAKMSKSRESSNEQQ